jgi:hypothetical protein
MSPEISMGLDEALTMKLPCLRFTTRRLMFAVAVVAVGLWLPSFVTAKYHDYLIFRHLHTYPPVALDLWYGRVAAGDDVERLIARTSPHRITRRGDFVVLVYYPGGPLRPGSLSFAATGIVAKNGVLVSAASCGCTFQHAYFNLMTQRDNDEFARRLSECPGIHPELGDRP